MQQHLVNLSGLSVRLRLPREWLRAEALAGRIPCLKVGRKMLFNPPAVEQALAVRAAGGVGLPVSATEGATRPTPGRGPERQARAAQPAPAPGTHLSQSPRFLQEGICEACEDCEPCEAVSTVSPAGLREL